MSLSEHIPKKGKDNFKASLLATGYDFPCNCCCHRSGRHTDEPCRSCGHNACCVETEEQGFSCDDDFDPWDEGV